MELGPEGKPDLTANEKKENFSPATTRKGIHPTAQVSLDEDPGIDGNASQLHLTMLRLTSKTSQKLEGEKLALAQDSSGELVSPLTRLGPLLIYWCRPIPSTAMANSLHSSPFPSDARWEGAFTLSLLVASLLYGHPTQSPR